MSGCSPGFRSGRPGSGLCLCLRLLQNAAVRQREPGQAAVQTVASAKECQRGSLSPRGCRGSSGHAALGALRWWLFCPRQRSLGCHCSGGPVARGQLWQAAATPARKRRDGQPQEAFGGISGPRGWQLHGPCTALCQTPQATGEDLGLRLSGLSVYCGAGAVGGGEMEVCLSLGSKR